MVKPTFDNKSFGEYVRGSIQPMGLNSLESRKSIQYQNLIEPIDLNHIRPPG